MKFISLICLSLMLTCVFALNPSNLKKAVREPEIVKQLNFAEKFWKQAQTFQKYSAGDMSFTCALCGIAVNEIQGWVAENISISEMENLLETTVCNNLSGFLKIACDDLVDQLPTVISFLDNRWSVSVACVNLGFCVAPFYPYHDPQPIPSYNINLDLDPRMRWKEVCSNPQFKSLARFLYTTVTSLLLYNGKAFEDIGEAIAAVVSPEYSQEIQGCAETLEIPYGWVMIFNLGYEVSDACTSMVAQTNDGKILHARNLDFWAGMGFTDSLKKYEFYW